MNSTNWMRTGRQREVVYIRMIRVVIEFKGSEMVEYDENGKKVYEGKWFGNMRSGYFSHERMEGMSGYFKEADSSGQLISVSEYDELNV